LALTQEIAQTLKQTDEDGGTAEFDHYAHDYGAGMENPIKALAGDSAEGFVAVKLSWLLRQFPDLSAKGESFRILDYGCGTATLLRLMAEAGLAASLLGCDVSVGMLEEARRRWPSGTPAPDLHVQDGSLTPIATGSVDLVIISAVLHHVAPEDRLGVYAELQRVLRPGGRLVVFEHNPLNPVTRYVVAHTPIDQNAILLRAREVNQALRGLEFSEPQTNYLMFIPPRLTALAGIERVLHWLPFGAQYAVTATRR
jgi:SAM-dependent methyltransferase